MTRRILQIGATGHTGALTAAALVAAGERPVLVGRDADALTAAAQKLAPDRPLETLVLDVTDVGALRRTIGGDDVVLSTVGRFPDRGRPVVEAAAEAGASYLDSSWEPGYIRWVFDKLGRRAQVRGARLMPGFGYDYVPGQLAGAWALESAAEVGIPFRLEVGYFCDGVCRASGARGLAAVTETALEPGFTFRGRVCEDRPAARTAEFEIGGHTRVGLSTGSAEHLTLPELAPSLSELDVYQGWFGWATEIVSKLSVLGPVIAGVPGSRALAGRISTLLAGGPDSEGPSAEAMAQGRSLVAARVTDTGGTVLAALDLEGPGPYPLTAQSLAWAAAVEAHTGPKTVHRRVGALGPVQAFGLDALRDAATQAGLEAQVVTAAG
ncbi:NAD(P)H-binding protein [Rhodococcus sp. D2-41]|uniref:Saccharopine dehydrogenase NADP-binding domain-containing protein n=1 Tax=Speluncibacter jeojiensis TaxID=2710754 RepID=A0A9X4LYY4_9ACTN|nr:saccharopine dehydrogenase NADP-binding domain-containing protein [Rhodococcus sp. D2-41]MDG3008730.1 NAD(P)H-binding protein [Rhodococcus sp. D2-41]MDG3013062.1 saccharopine dehydrogenase NADP-binding domain-containing protein [Corynebacteriales bacterium D3-21]